MGQVSFIAWSSVCLEEFIIDIWSAVIYITSSVYCSLDRDLACMKCSLFPPLDLILCLAFFLILHTTSRNLVLNSCLLEKGDKFKGGSAVGGSC